MQVYTESNLEELTEISGLLKYIKYDSGVPASVIVIDPSTGDDITELAFSNLRQILCNFKHMNFIAKLCLFDSIAESQASQASPSIYIELWKLIYKLSGEPKNLCICEDGEFVYYGDTRKRRRSAAIPIGDYLARF